MKITFAEIDNVSFDSDGDIDEMPFPEERPSAVSEFEIDAFCPPATVFHILQFIKTLFDSSENPRG